MLMLNNLIGFGASAPEGALSADPDVNAYLLAMSVTPDATRIGHLETLIGGLKTDGVWSKLEWLSILAAHDAQAARINAVNPAQIASETGTLTFTTDRGYTGDGSSGSLDTGVLGTDVGETDNCMFGFVRTVSTVTGSSVIGASANLGVAHNTGSSTIAYRGRTSASATRSRSPDAPILVGGRRTGSSLNAFRGDGSGVSHGTVQTRSTGGVTGNVRILAGSTGGFSNGELSTVGWGQYLSDAECTALNTHLRTYLTAVGAF
jgi:hypothetical protein